MSMTIGPLKPSAAAMEIAQQFPGNIPTYAASGPYRNHIIAAEVAGEMLRDGPKQQAIATFKDSDNQFYVVRLNPENQKDLESAQRALKTMFGQDIVPFSLAVRDGDRVGIKMFPQPKPVQPGEFL